MPATFRGIGSSTLLVVLLAAAQPTASQTTPLALSLRPEVIQDADLRYPPQAWENDVEGDVVLLLWVDEEGRVEAGEVVSTPGYGMELAALAGLLSLVSLRSLRARS